MTNIFPWQQMQLGAGSGVSSGGGPIPLKAGTPQPPPSPQQLPGMFSGGGAPWQQQPGQQGQQGYNPFAGSMPMGLMRLLSQLNLPQAGQGYNNFYQIPQMQPGNAPIAQGPSSLPVIGPPANDPSRPVTTVGTAADPTRNAFEPPPPPLPRANTRRFVGRDK